MTPSTPWPVDRIRQAIADPRSVVGPCRSPFWRQGHPNYAPAMEEFKEWAARAVVAVLDEFDRALAEQVDAAVEVVTAPASRPPIDERIPGFDPEQDHRTTVSGMLAQEAGWSCSCGTDMRGRYVIAQLASQDAKRHQAGLVPMWFKPTTDRAVQLRDEMVRNYTPLLPLLDMSNPAEPIIYARIADRMPPGVEAPQALREEFPAELGDRPQPEPCTFLEPGGCSGACDGRVCESDGAR